VANEFTSIATTPGLSDAVVKAAYDLAIGEELRTYPAARQFVTKRPGDPAHNGSSVTLTKYADFSEAAVTAAKTPLTEEADVDSTKMPAASTVTVTPAEYGFAVTRTKKLVHRSFADIDPEIVRAIGFHQARVLDELIQDTWIAGLTTVGSNKIWVGSNTAESTYTAADELTASVLRRVKLRFVSNGVQPFYGNAFAAFVNPQVVLDLREESGSGGWRQPNEYGQDQSKIWAGEIGMFEGFRFVENPRVRYTKTGSGSGSTQVRVLQNFFFGRDSTVEWVKEEPHTVYGPVVDKLGRFRTFGWYGDLGWNVYEAKAAIRVLSSSSENQLLPA
jgi:N4-gp56 family major capsid protein